MFRLRIKAERTVVKVSLSQLQRKENYPNKSSLYR